MNKQQQTIEEVLHQASKQIEVPSREQFRPIFDRVTKSEVVRYSEQSRISRWFHQISRFQKTVFVSMATSIAIIALVIIPAYSPQSDVAENALPDLEIEREMVLLNQEDVLVDYVVENYLGTITSLTETDFK